MLIISMVENWAKVHVRWRREKKCETQNQEFELMLESAVKWRWSEQLLYHKSTNLSSVIFTTNESCWSRPPTLLLLLLLLLAKPKEAKCISTRGIKKGFGNWNELLMLEICKRACIIVGCLNLNAPRFEWCLPSNEWQFRHCRCVSFTLYYCCRLPCTSLSVCKRGAPQKMPSLMFSRSQYEGSS